MDIDGSLRLDVYNVVWMFFKACLCVYYKAGDGMPT